MPWFRVDDKLHDHRKSRVAGVPAMGLWVLAGAWAADNVTDGFIPQSVCSRWERGYKKLAALLVTAGFWEPGELDGESGWWFHDWKDQQPSRDEVLTKRAEARARMARVRANKGNGSREQTANVQPNYARSSEEVRVTPSRPVPTHKQTPTVSAATELALVDSETEPARANRLTKTFTDKVKLSNFPAVAGVVRKAVKAGYDDAAIIAALGRLADDGRSVTTDTLRIELEGRAPTGSRQRETDTLFENAARRMGVIS